MSNAGNAHTRRRRRSRHQRHLHEMIGQAGRTSVFARIADISSRLVGSPRGFVFAVMFVAVWAITGPAFGFSSGWQLVINTGTNIVTFLIVFLLQATQNRDSAAIHLKLDELVRATQGASNELLDMETLTPEALEKIRADYEKLAAAARAAGNA